MWNRFLNQRLISLRLNFLKDYLGSIRVIVGANGNVVAYNDYYPFGLEMPGRVSCQSGPDCRYKFTGKERDDETKYDYYVI